MREGGGEGVREGVREGGEGVREGGEGGSEERRREGAILTEFKSIPN